MRPTEVRVGVVPLGNPPDRVLKVIVAQFIGILRLAADILPPMEDPMYAFDNRRLQYDAAAIISALEASRDDAVFRDYDKVVGVVDVDLFVPIFSHVLGEARLGGKFALVSLYRLERNLERAAKIALHEFGHLCRLDHCADTRCLMHFSKGVGELDSLPLYFCRYCALFIQNALSP